MNRFQNFLYGTKPGNRKIQDPFQKAFHILSQSN